MSKSLPQLTNDGRAIVANAKRVAAQHKLQTVDSDALLLAALQLPKSQALDVLKTLNVKTDNFIARLSATIELEAKQANAGQASKRGDANLSEESEAVFDESLAEAQSHGLNIVDARLLILGMLRSPASKAGEFLAQYGVTAEQFRERAKIKDAPPSKQPRIELPKVKGFIYEISPIFISLLVFTTFAGWFAYLGFGNPKFFMFCFVMGGWIISVSLHEFGHALAAYWGGDESVVENGYLTLNPLKYTHPFLSIVLPVIILLMGGIGFPGGAVYINPNALRSAGVRSLVSAAGVIANFIFVVMLSIPFALLSNNLNFAMDHFEFLAGLGFLAFLQITSILINLLPIPGLDGFGIIEPYLPQEMVEVTNFLRPFGFMILFVALSTQSPIQDMFWQNVWDFAMFINYDMAYFANEGLKLFLAWQK